MCDFEWNPAVTTALRQAADMVSGWRILGVAVDRNGHLNPVMPDWAALVESGRPVTMVVRIDTSMARLNATELVKSLGAQVERWHAAGVSLAGLEIDVWRLSASRASRTFVAAVGDRAADLARGPGLRSDHRCRRRSGFAGSRGPPTRPGRRSVQPEQRHGVAEADGVAQYQAVSPGPARLWNPHRSRRGWFGGGGGKRGPGTRGSAFRGIGGCTRRSSQVPGRPSGQSRAQSGRNRMVSPAQYRRSPCLEPRHVTRRYQRHASEWQRARGGGRQRHWGRRLIARQ
ncbi:MAG: DUF3142 domain-containing protein [Alphaproteobacteria bacterium]|nr:DUF3142 domain-containing protein [Alphaproteobacteria bacterium]